MPDVPYHVVIGLEVHVQLLTRTKLFCGCSSEGWLEIDPSPQPLSPKGRGAADALPSPLGGEGLGVRGKRIGIIRVHLEEDAGKLLHDESGGGSESRVDLNRTG